ncbi:roundabout homolog 2 [Aplysia californica]|uniref:Roundabout homolog 2 n=1 Tax=Aplysia californica TaxID=6500 RepID=A0ABM1W2K6_APLCA|nr:roundabout homolog 2 [Aplysia californica]
MDGCIEKVEYRDEGTFVCQALNTLANVKASAVLTVVDHDSRPPPIVLAGPQNQTLEPKEVALMPCAVKGQPVPSVRWYKDSKPLISADPRVAVLSSGTLQISDVRLTDSGLYTCKAISETGEAEWEAWLTVSSKWTVDGGHTDHWQEKRYNGSPLWMGISIVPQNLTADMKKRTNFAVNMPRPEIVKELGALNIELKTGEPINSTAVKVKWEVRTYCRNC